MTALEEVEVVVSVRIGEDWYAKKAAVTPADFRDTLQLMCVSATRLVNRHWQADKSSITPPAVEANNA